MKISVIIGKRQSGKSTLAKEISFGYKYVEVNPLDLSVQGFSFSNCEKDTELIIIDGVKTIEVLEDIVCHTYNYVAVQKQGRNTFFINPNIVIVCDENITKEIILKSGVSLNRRINLIGIL